MRQYLPVLRRVPLFAGLEEEQLMEALECLAARVKCAAKAAAVFRAGEKAAALGCVLSGGVQVCREDASGERIVLAGLEAGELFGEAYAFAQDNTLAVSVYALEPTTVLLVPARRLLEPCQRACPFHARLIRNLVTLLAEKNLQLSRNIRYLSARTIREKLTAYLEEQALRAGQDSFTVPFDRQALADYLCVDRSALSRELGRMRSEGLLEFERSRFTQILGAKRPHGFRAAVFIGDVSPEILFYQFLQQLVPIQLADQGAGVVVVGDIGGVLREDVSHDLIDGIIALFLQRAVYATQDLLDLRVLFVLNAEFPGVIHLHAAHLLVCFWSHCS